MVRLSWKAMCMPCIRPLLLESDTPLDRERKTIFVPALIVGMVLTLLSRIGNALQGEFYLQLFFTPAIFAVIIAYFYKTKALPQRVIEGVCGLLCLAYIHYDLMYSGVLDMWVTTIIVLDLLLLMQCHSRLSVAVRITVVLYLVLKSIEETAEFGLYEVFSPYITRKCEPLTTSHSITLFGVRAGTFLLDFAITRSFASGLYRQQATMQAHITTAEHIAGCLARFDLDSAQQILDDSPERGSKLHDAFRTLLGNLVLYRPYLPDSLFQEESVNIPFEANHRVFQARTIVFTDIQSSCDLWEACPGGMKKALVLHNEVVRETVQHNNGYEVKTIGDSFMVAFSNATDACLFTINAQRRLLAADWPSDILQQPLCRPAEGKWRGLRVRMGVHTGEMDMQMNPVTGRADYFGPTVNIAARVEGKAKGGCTLVTEDVLEEFESMGEDYATIRYGRVSLKGVGQGFELYYLMPSELLERCSECPAEALVTVSVSSNGSTPQMTCTSPVDGVFPDSLVSHTLKKTRATVVHTCVAHDDGGASMNEVVSTFIDLVERSEGVVLTVCSTALVASWNTSRACPMHVSLSARFAGLVHRQSASWSGSTTVGIATGDVLHGNVGNRVQRFITLLGANVEVAGYLAALAADLPTFVLATGVGGAMCIAHDQNMRQSARKVAEVFGCQVFELEAKNLTKVWGGEEVLLWGWSDECREAIERSDWAVLRQHAENDPKLERVLRSLSGDDPLVYRPPLINIWCPPRVSDPSPSLPPIPS